MIIDVVPQGIKFPAHSIDSLLLTPYRPDGAAQVSFSCPSERRGTILSLSVPAQCKDMAVHGDFAKHIIKHINHWFAFAQDHGFEINHKDIILVTSCHLAKSWANIIFQESLMEECMLFGVQVAENSNVNWRFMPEGVRGMPCNLSPSGQVCFCTIFLRQRRDMMVH